MLGRILITDATATNRIILKVKLGDAFYEPLLADSGMACLGLARSEAPDLILLDLTLPDLPGLEVLEQLRADPRTRTIPVVALTASRESALRVAALKAGAEDVLPKPVNDRILLARIRNLLRARDAAGLMTQAWGSDAPGVLQLSEAPATFETAGTIGLFASRPGLAVSWKHLLQLQMRDRLAVLSRENLLSLPGEMGDGAPDVYVLDVDNEQQAGGLRLMTELRSHPPARHSAFCVVVPDGDEGTTVMAYDLGAEDVVPRSLLDSELAPRLRTLLRRKRQGDRLRATVEDGLRLAMIDPLTGTHNRRYAMPRLAGIAAQAAAEGVDFAVMVVDLDRFKLVNDRYGHAAGDTVLVEVARRLTDNLRMTDLLARIGGEEFLVALPQTSLAEAQRVAERLRSVVGDRPVRLPDGTALKVTVSIGVSVCPPQEAEPDRVAALVDRADRALLNSKTAGRNVVTIGQSAA